MSNGSVWRVLKDTHTHMDGTDLIPSTADAGGNNNGLGIVSILEEASW